MLNSLSISNYAIIDHLSITLNKGFTVITGETGAGKSIILGALMMILGERIDTKVISKKDKKSVIEASFDMGAYNLKSFFEENDWEYEPNECILRREILSSGRSRAFINDSPVSLSQLRLLAMNLIDIHSQHNNLLLADSQYQLSIIDEIADIKVLKQEYLKAFNAYKTALKKLEDMKKQIAEAKADEDYNRFQLDQFNQLNLLPGEEEELEAMQSQLSNVSEIKENIWDILDNLDGENSSVIQSLKRVEQRLAALNTLVKDTDDFTERINAALIEIKDIKSSIEDLDAKIEVNPAELERVNDRLNGIYNLKKKHNVSTVDELLAIQDAVRSKLSTIENSTFELETLQDVLGEKEKELTIVADKLTKQRKIAASKFVDELIRMAKPLGMPNIMCNVAFEQEPYSKTGQDRVQFLVSFNKNQSPLPLGNTASGGELSRLMLSVKTIIANKMHLPTVVFDEIDTGVSGEIADKMGKMMGSIAKEMQVVAITHLPQVAAIGDNHYKVYKKDTNDSTITDIKELSIQERIQEIAGMLGAGGANEAAINNAKSLLQIN